MNDDTSLSEDAFVFGDGVMDEKINLSRKLNLAIDALKFYADSDCYERFGRDDLSEIEEDGGEMARNVLEEIEK